MKLRHIINICITKGHATPVVCLSPFHGENDMWQYRETHFIGMPLS